MREEIIEGNIGKSRKKMRVVVVYSLQCAHGGVGQAISLTDYLVSPEVGYTRICGKGLCPHCFSWISDPLIDPLIVFPAPVTVGCAHAIV